MTIQIAKTNEAPAPEGARGRLDTSRLEVRIARSPEELQASQELRYKIFYEEMAAAPTPEMAAAGRDFDHFDSICDHLLVFDWNRPGPTPVVGSYRLLRQFVAEQHDGFYSSSEFDLSSILKHQNRREGQFLELGRSCVAPEYRTNAVISLLWRGITHYLVEHKVTLMFGCGSLPGLDLEVLALPLSYLYHYHLAPPERRVRALDSRYVSMNRMPKEQVNQRDGLRSLPPLIKGYLRLGGIIGDGAVVDDQFGTTDCFIMVPCETLTGRYIAHFGFPDGTLPVPLS